MCIVNQLIRCNTLFWYWALVPLQRWFFLSSLWSHLLKTLTHEGDVSLQLFLSGGAVLHEGSDLQIGKSVFPWQSHLLTRDRRNVSGMTNGVCWKEEDSGTTLFEMSLLLRGLVAVRECTHSILRWCSCTPVQHLMTTTQRRSALPVCSLWVLAWSTYCN